MIIDISKGLGEEYLNLFIMKKLLIILLFLSFSEAFSQTQNRLLGCGSEAMFLAGQTYNIDTLKIDCYRSMLLQEGAVVNINVVEYVSPQTLYNGLPLRVMWGDSRDTIPREQMISMPQVDSEGNEYTDYRHPDADLPLISFNCRPADLIVGDYVDVIGTVCEQEIDENDNVVITEDTIIQLWTLLGQLYYEGPYDGLFNGSCGVGCLSEEYWNIIWVLRWSNESGQTFSKKKVWVR